MSVLLLLLFIYVISPIPLLIAMLHYRKKNRELEREYYYLKEQLHVREKAEYEKAERERIARRRQERAQNPPEYAPTTSVSLNKPTAETPPEALQTSVRETAEKVQTPAPEQAPVYTAAAKPQHVQPELSAVQTPHAEEKRETAVQTPAPAAEPAPEYAPKAAAIQPSPVQPAIQPQAVQPNTSTVFPSAENTSLPPSSVFPSAENTFLPPPSSFQTPHSTLSSGRKVSAVNVIIALGMLFVVLAGLVFAASSWSALPPIGKAGIISSFAPVLLFVHFVMERRFENERVGKVFYILSAAALSVAVFSVSVLKVFEGFDLKNAPVLTAALMSLSVSIYAVVGALHYKSRTAARVGYIAFTLFMAGTAIHFSSVYGTIILALISLAFLLTEKKVTESSFNEVLCGEYPFFAKFNIYVCALSSLFLSDGELIFALPALIFSAAFLLSAFRKQNTFADVSAFSVYLMLGAYLSLRPEGVDNILLAALPAVTIYTVLSLMNVIPDNIRKTVTAFRVISSVLMIGGGLLLTITNTEFNVSVLFTAVCVCLMLIISVVMRDDKASLYALCPSFILTAAELGKLAGTYSPVVLSAALLVYIIAIRIAKKFYTPSADIIGTVTVLICLFRLMIQPAGGVLYNNAMPFVTWAVLLMICIICAVWHSPEALGKVFNWVAPIAALLICIPVIGLESESFGFAEQRGVVVIAYFICAVIALLAERGFKKPFAALALIPMFLTFLGADGMMIVPCCAAVYYINCVVCDKLNFRDMPFGAVGDIAVCSYMGLALLYALQSGGIWYYSAVIWVLLCICAVIAYKPVSKIALPISLIMLVIPLYKAFAEYGLNTDICIVISFAVYGIFSFIAMKKRTRWAGTAVYFLPVMLLIALLPATGDFALAAFIGAAVLALLAGPEDFGRTYTKVCTTAAALLAIFIHTNLLQSRLALAVWAAGTLILCAEKRESSSAVRFALPPMVLFGAVPLYNLLSICGVNYDWRADIPITAAMVLYCIVFIIMRSVRREDEALANVFRVCSYSSVLLAGICMGYERKCIAPLMIAVTAVILFIEKKPERKIWHTVSMLTLTAVSLVTSSILLLSRHTLPGLVNDDVQAVNSFVIWAVLAVSAVYENRRRASQPLEMGVIAAVGSILLPACALYYEYDLPAVVPALIFVGVMTLFRLICVVKPLISEDGSKYIAPVCGIFVLLVMMIQPATIHYAAAAILLICGIPDAVRSFKADRRRGIMLYHIYIFITAVNIGRLFPEDMNFIVIASTLTAIFLPALITKNAIGRASRFTSLFTLPIAAGLFIMYGASNSLTVLICGYVLLAVTVLSCITAKNTVSLFALLPLSYIFLLNTADKWTVFARIAIPMAAVMLIGRLVFFKKLSKEKFFADSLSMTAPFGGLLLMLIDFTGDGKMRWLGIVMIALSFLLLWRKENSVPANRTFLTVSALAILPLCWAQPFFTYPEVIEREMALLPLAAVLALLYAIHKEHRRVIDIFSFLTAIVSLFVLTYDAITLRLVPDAVILGFVIFCILGLSFLFRQKRWFALAVSAAAAEAILMSLQYWNSRTWWIYLLAAGVILISVGLAAARRRRHDAQGKKSKLRATVEEWTW